MNVKGVRTGIERVQKDTLCSRESEGAELGTGAKLPPFTFQELLRARDMDLIQAQGVAPHLIQ